MNARLASAIVAAMVVAGTAVSPAKATTALIDFETTPSLSTGPSIYVAVPGPQTITTTPATFTGGVVLGNATFFPAISFATIPNVYGTADFGNHLPEALTITMAAAFTTTEVSFALFNGEVFNQSYSVDAFNGTTVVGNQTLNNIPANFNAGYGLVDLTAPGGITSVVITPVGNPSAWDFLIDTVGFNQNINTVILPPVIQPPVDPVQGHLHGGKEGETELVEVNFGDDVNNIRGSVVVVPTPEPASLALLTLGAIVLMTRRRT